MSGHHQWSELVAEMPAERRKRIKEDADTLHREYTLSEIRRQAGLTQCQMAEKLNVSNRLMHPSRKVATCEWEHYRRSLPRLVVSCH